MIDTTTTLDELLNRIKTQEALIGVIGLGYVGLPVAAVFAEAGFRVIGVDLKPDRVDLINAGMSPIEGREPGLAELLAKVVSNGRLRATINYDPLAEVDVTLIAVDTPVDKDHIPRFETLSSALRSIGKILRKGALIVVESTIAPGTMNSLVGPLLEEVSGYRVGEEIHLGHCPERVMPGRLLHNIRNVSRVCGGSTPEAGEVMKALYEQIVDADLDVVDCVTAELVKTAENAYRDVNIAFVNELALICEAVGGDVWQVRELVNKVPGRNVLLPGAGVGGHCIPKDPWLLAYGAEDSDVPVRLIPAARKVNDGMPQHIVNLAVECLKENGKEISEAGILVLGYAYLENSDDDRNSPSAALVELLQAMEAEVTIHDPYITRFQGDIQRLLNGKDIVIIMVAHDIYRNLLPELYEIPVVIDGRGLWRDSPPDPRRDRYCLVGRGIVNTRIPTRVKHQKLEE